MEHIQTSRQGNGDKFTEFSDACSFAVHLTDISKPSTILIRSDGKTTTAQLRDGKTTVKEAKAVCNPADSYSFETGASLALNRLLYGTDYHPDEVKLTPTVREVKRPAKVGEWVKVVASNLTSGEYENGDIAKVRFVGGNNVIVEQWRRAVGHKEYVVLENYTPQQDKQEDNKKPKYYSGKVVCVKAKNSFTVGKVYEFADGKVKDDDGDMRPHPLQPSERIQTLEAWNGIYSCAKFIEFCS